MTKYICLDLETTAIDDVTGHREVDILGYGVASVRYSEAKAWTDESKAWLLSANEQAKNGEVVWVFHNASFDVPVLRRHGVDIQPGTYHDTQIMSWVLDPSHESYSLDNCCHRYGIEGKFQTPDSWEAWTDYMAKYCEQDCISTINLYHEVMDLLTDDAKATSMYMDIELPYIECIIEFEETGFVIDDSKLSQLISELEYKRGEYAKALDAVTGPIPDKLVLVGDHFEADAELSEKTYPKSKQHMLNPNMVKQLCEVTIPNDKEDEYVKFGWTVTKRNTKTIRVANEQWIADPFEDSHPDNTLVGHHQGVWPHCKLKEFNPNSGQQLAYVLHSTLGWVPSKFTKTGQPKTDEEALGWMRDEHPFIDAYLNLTEVNKMLDSFLYKFEKLKDENHVLRGNFNHTGTCTGRLSASNP